MTNPTQTGASVWAELDELPTDRRIVEEAITIIDRALAAARAEGFAAGQERMRERAAQALGNYLQLTHQREAVRTLPIERATEPK